MPCCATARPGLRQEALVWYYRVCLQWVLTISKTTQSWAAGGPPGDAQEERRKSPASHDRQQIGKQLPLQVSPFYKRKKKFWFAYSVQHPDFKALNTKWITDWVASQGKTLRSPLGFCVVTQGEMSLQSRTRIIPIFQNLHRPEHLLKGRRHSLSFLLQGCTCTPLFLQYLHENCMNIYQFYLHVCCYPL